MGRRVAFRTAHGKFLCVEPDGRITADRNAIGPWETFEEIDVEGGGAELRPKPQPEPGDGAADPSPEPRPGGGPVPAGRIIQVSDEPGILNRGYSYWSQAWVTGSTALVFAGHQDGQPRFYSVELATGHVQALGPLLGHVGTAEGMFWSIAGELTYCDGPRLRRVNPLTGQQSVVFDISDAYPGCRLWQAHSSDDAQAHSATVERIVSDGPYPRIATVAWRRGELHRFPSGGALDESQIDRSGAYLVIKEGDDNIIVTLGTDRTRNLADRDGALGHSDCGPGFVIGEDNIHGACVRVDLRSLERRTLFRTWNMGEVSVRAGKCLHGDAQGLRLVDPDGGWIGERVAHGMTGSGYDYQVHANLSPCGRVAAFVSNQTGRFEMYILVL